MVHVALAPGQAESANRRQAAGRRRQRERRQALRDRDAGCTSTRWSCAARSPIETGSASRVASADPVLHARIRRSIAARLRPPGDRPVRGTGVSPARARRTKWNGSCGSFDWPTTAARAYERAVQLALTTVLASPRFLFLVEPEEAREDRPLTEFELASRLSYFLWSSMPDDELFREARAGTLRANLRRQVVRMLEDPRSDAVRGELRRPVAAAPQAGRRRPRQGSVPRLRRRVAARRCARRPSSTSRTSCGTTAACWNCSTPTTRSSTRRWRDITRSRASTGDEFRQVALADRRRGGVLTQASVLTLTSNPNRTSPVKRGQWILQQILGTPPPPPPPDVAKLDESQQAADAASLRERMELHRTKPECASCHQQMDPLGFALENYDAVGRWRTMDGGFPIDPSGELIGGRKFADIKELKQLLRSHGRQEIHAVSGREHANLWPGTRPGSLRLLHGRGHPASGLPPTTIEIQNIIFGIVESQGVPVSGHRPMIDRLLIEGNLT